MNAPFTVSRFPVIRPRVRRRLAFGLVSLSLGVSLLATMGCRRSTPPTEAEPPAAAPGAAAAGATAPGDVPAAPEPAVPEALRARLEELQKHGGCSLLMGCPPAEALLREGADAVEPLVALYRKTAGDAYWRQQVLEVLGRIGDERALSFLVERLRDPAERLQVDAALALGHMKAPGAVAVLQERFAATSFEADPALRMALAYALVRGGDDAPRQEIFAALSAAKSDALNAGQIRTLLTIVRWLDARGREDVRSFVLRALPNANLFVRRDALRLVGDWELRAAVPRLFPLLEDESPGVRKEALETLQRLTGFRHKTTRDQWERWCREDPGCELPPAEGAEDGTATKGAVTKGAPPLTSPPTTAQERCQRFVEVVWACGGKPPKDPTVDSGTHRNNLLVIEQEMIRQCTTQRAFELHQRCAVEHGHDCRAFANCVEAGQTD